MPTHGLFMEALVEQLGIQAGAKGVGEEEVKLVLQPVMQLLPLPVVQGFFLVKAEQLLGLTIAAFKLGLFQWTNLLLKAGHQHLALLLLGGQLLFQSGYLLPAVMKLPFDVAFCRCFLLLTLACFDQ